MAKLKKKSDNTDCWEGGRTIETAFIVGGFAKWYNHFETVYQFLTKQDIGLGNLWNPAITEVSAQLIWNSMSTQKAACESFTSYHQLEANERVLLKVTG